MCEEIPFRHQLASLAALASYANDVERFLWARSQTNEIFSAVNTVAAAAAAVARWGPPACGRRLHGGGVCVAGL